MNYNPTDVIDENSGLLLARCLDDIEAGRATVQSCAARYPALAPALAWRPACATCRR